MDGHTEWPEAESSTVELHCERYGWLGRPACCKDELCCEQQQHVVDNKLRAQDERPSSAWHAPRFNGHLRVCGEKTSLNYRPERQLQTRPMQGFQAVNPPPQMPDVMAALGQDVHIPPADRDQRKEVKSQTRDPCFFSKQANDSASLRRNIYSSNRSRAQEHTRQQKWHQTLVNGSSTIPCCGSRIQRNRWRITSCWA